MNSQDPTRTRQILREYLPHAHNMFLPRSLGGTLKQAGFDLRVIDAIPILETHYHGFWRYASHFIANYLRKAIALQQSCLGEEDVEAWLLDLQHTAESGQSFFCLNRFMFVATKSIE
eukprot:TRINITY_DN3396_c0_g1_i2.p3 TRINITY_DN3396_c0_g1~~TRINITY_DN3396_c0_g1_i2.p3  ORF type:complete len:117 (+),score=19.89 TRINITY_DN3396_c0_g1_i2:741-1091(+)